LREKNWILSNIIVLLKNKLIRLLVFSKELRWRPWIDSPLFQWFKPFKPYTSQPRRNWTSTRRRRWWRSYNDFQGKRVKCCFTVSIFSQVYSFDIKVSLEWHFLSELFPILSSLFCISFWFTTCLTTPRAFVEG